MRRFFTSTAHLWLYSAPVALFLWTLSGFWRMALFSICVSFFVQTVHALDQHEDEFGWWLQTTIVLFIIAVITSFSQAVAAILDGWPIVHMALIGFGVALWDSAFHMRRHAKMFSRCTARRKRKEWVRMLCGGVALMVTGILPF